MCSRSIAHPGGVLVRAGHTEACCDLARLAGLAPAAVLCEIMRDDGTMARLPDLLEFAAAHKLKIGTIADLIEYRSRTESLVQRTGERDVDAVGPVSSWCRTATCTVGSLHLALVSAKPEPKADTLVRVHEPLSILDLLDAGASTHSWAWGKRCARSSRRSAGVMVLMNCNQDEARAPNTARSLTCGSTASARRSCATSASARCASWPRRARCRAWRASASK